MKYINNEHYTDREMHNYRLLPNLDHIADYWGSDRLLNSHHLMYIHEFGDSAYVIKADNQIIAYLFGFIAQTSPTAMYI